MHYNLGRRFPTPAKILQTRSIHSGCNRTDRTPAGVKKEKKRKERKQQRNWNKCRRTHKGFPSLSTRVSRSSLLQSHTWIKLPPDLRVLSAVCYLLYVICCVLSSQFNSQKRQSEHKTGRKISPKSGKSQQFTEQE